METTDPKTIIKSLEHDISEKADKIKTLAERVRVQQRNLDNINAELIGKQSGHFNKGPYPFDGITFVIAYYNIPKQIIRTLISCSPKYQRAAKDKIEVIIADNGSTEPLPEGLRERFPFISKIIRTEGRPSPVFALNDAIKQAKFPTIAVLIDGAHILSPGIFNNAKDICQMHPRPVINVPQYYLGFVSQNLNPAPNPWLGEKRHLARINWPAEGYNLLNYAIFPGENHDRSLIGSIETNCLITTREVFEDCGGFDERFDEPGAGFANLEIFSRLIHHPKNTYVIFPGEGSFHQDHGGTTTKKSPEERDILVARFRENHSKITGSEYLINVKSPMMYGILRHSAGNIATISKEYGVAKNMLLKQLANIYTGRVRAGIEKQPPPILVSGGTTNERRARVPLAALGILESTATAHGVDKAELSYLRFLRRLHAVRKPDLYFEIGVDTGVSIGLAQKRSIGVDPAFTITSPLSPRTQLFKEKSDDFFKVKDRAKTLFKTPLDMSFIDGMHLAEFVLRDFINVEKYAHKGSIIMFDDVLPEQMEMSERERRFAAWTGDVYKIAPILRKYRPDLEVRVFNTFIGAYRKGLAVVKNLDPANTILEDNYQEIEKEIFDETYAINSIAHLDEMMQVAPHSEFETFIAL